MGGVPLPLLAMSGIDGFHAVVPAGGSGTRLWPLSRAASPKFLHDLTGSGRSLLQSTVARLTPLAGTRIVVVTGVAHEEAVASQLAPEIRIVAEPAPRGSMAAIGLAAAMIEREDPEAIIGSFAADHVITDLEAFEDVVHEAVGVARTGRLVTIGIRPTYAATGFGYIRAGAGLPAFDTAREVVEFVEKPSPEVAAQYLASGEYRWNAGMFVVRARVLLDLLARWHPDLAEGLRAIAADPALLEMRWESLSAIAIDHAVAEPAAAVGAVAVVPAGFGWDDIGDFASLGSLLPGRSDGVTVLGDGSLVEVHDSSALVVPAGGRMIAVVGIDDVVVVDTGDAVLVTTKDRAQDVRKIVEVLKEHGRERLT